MSRSHFIGLMLFCSVVSAQDGIDINLLYDNQTGNVSVEANLDAIGILRMASESGIFTGELGRGIYKQHAHLVEFPMGGRRFGPKKDLGLIATTGLWDAFLAADICIDANSTINSLSIMGIPQLVTNEKCVIQPDPSLPMGDPVKTVVFNYNSTNGNLFVDVGDNARLTTLLIESPQFVFSGDRAKNLGHVFDVHRHDEIFKLLPQGFSDVDFGNVVQKGLTNNEFLTSICAIGTWVGGGATDVLFQYPGAGQVPIERRQDDQCQGETVPTDVHVSYDPNVGHFTISVDDLIPDGARAEDAKFTILQVESASGIFVGTPENLNGPNDFFSSHRVIKHDPNSFDKLELGAVVRPGLSLPFIWNDLFCDAVLSSSLWVVPSNAF